MLYTVYQETSSVRNQPDLDMERMHSTELGESTLYH